MKMLQSIYEMNDVGYSTDDDVRVGVIRHGGLLEAFTFARPIRGSGHV